MSHKSGVGIGIKWALGINDHNNSEIQSANGLGRRWDGNVRGCREMSEMSEINRENIGNIGIEGGRK